MRFISNKSQIHKDIPAIHLKMIFIVVIKCLLKSFNILVQNFEHDGIFVNSALSKII